MGRFFRRGVSEALWLPAIAATETVGTSLVPGDPTAPEIAAGTPLTVDLADISGFQLSNSPIAVPNMADSFTSQIEGEDTVADSSFTFYDRDDATTIRTALAKGSDGFVVLAPYGMGAGKRLQIYPATTTGVNDEFSIGNEAARFMVGLAITGTPNLNATHP